MESIFKSDRPLLKNDAEIWALKAIAETLQGNRSLDMAKNFKESMKSGNNTYELYPRVILLECEPLEITLSQIFQKNIMVTCEINFIFMQLYYLSILNGIIYLLHK